MKMKETDLARAVVSYLESSGWDVYQEVLRNPHSMGGYGSPRCDIFAVKGGVRWAIECKMSLGFRVLEQVEKWKGYANMVSVAVKRPRFGKSTYL